MEIRKYTNLRAFNQLAMSEFWLDRVEYDKNYPAQNAVFIAGRGYIDHFGAEIKFIEIEYIACERFFTDFTLHQGLVNDSPLLHEYPESNVYYFEESTSVSGELPKRYYVIAKNIEITAHYAGENVEIAFGRSDRIEAGEEEDLANATPLPNEKESKHSPSRQGFLVCWRNFFSSK